MFLIFRIEKYFALRFAKEKAAKLGPFDSVSAWDSLTYRFHTSLPLTGWAPPNSVTLCLLDK